MGQAAGRPSDVPISTLGSRIESKMQQRIVGFHQDEFGDWVAELECNHNQHVRHQPPFQLRPWVTSEQGRHQHLGSKLECAKCNNEPDHLRANRSLVRRYYEELWNNWNLKLIPELLASDFRFRGWAGFAAQGHTDFRDYIERIRAAFPDLRNHVEWLLAEDNRVVAHLHCTGTHRGKSFGVEPAGGHVSCIVVATFTVGGHQLRSACEICDRYELMSQLNALST
jgi:predicted ester cyclase